MTIPAERPDIDALTADYLYTQMLARLYQAEKAEAAYLTRDAFLRERNRKRTPGDPDQARVNAAIDTLTDPLLRLHAFLTGHHRDWARTYAAALQGMAAHSQLAPDRPVPPDGRRPAPGSAAAVDRAAAGESPDGGPTPSRAGANPGPRPVPPAAPGARPGTGPGIEPGMTVSYELRHGPGAPGTVAGTVIAVRADGTAQVRFRQDGGAPFEVIAPSAAFSPVQTASGGGDPRA